MQIYHLNCGSMEPPLTPLRGVCYCLLVESTAGLVLVDTGFGYHDCLAPAPLTRVFRVLIGAPLEVDETALSQVQALGFRPQDVRHIVLTHVHLDHAGGLPDFPWAEVHVHHTEFNSIARPRLPLEYAHIPGHFAHAPRWVLYDQVDESWFGLPAMRVLPGESPEILLVPLPGHTRGHCGVAIRTTRGWLLHAGDAISPFHRQSDPQDLPAQPRPLNVLPDWMVRRILGGQVAPLRRLLEEHGDEIEVISSHDGYRFARNSHPSAGI